VRTQRPLEATVRLVAAAVDEAGAEDPVAVAKEGVGACHSSTPKSASKSSVSVYRHVLLLLAAQKNNGLSAIPR
jgi:hypothetical protein